MEGITLWCDAFLVLQGKGGQNERKTETASIISAGQDFVLF